MAGRSLVLALSIIAVAALTGSLAVAQNDGGWFPLKADDGTEVANYRVPVELESQIEAMPGVVVVGNPRGDVTLVEFYDLNCPFCRKAAAEIEALLQSDRELRLVLVPFPVLGVQSIQAGRVELAIATLATAQQFHDFHRRIYAGRGTIDGARALAVARQMGLPEDKIIKTADEEAITKMMIAHVRLGDSLGFQATPAFVIKGVAIVGYPGGRSLAGIVGAVRACDQVVC